MDIFEEVVRMRRAGERGALATIVHTNGSIPSYESSRMLVRDDGSIVGTVGGGCVEAEVWAAAKEVIVTEQPRKMVFNLNHDAQYDAGLICGGTLEIFVEPVLPQPTLYIFGGGHVSTAVAPLAHQAGFKIAIVDDRESFANADRFPMATEIFTSYDEAFEKIQPSSSTYLLIVTRGHSGDMRVLAWAVGCEARGFTPRYIGMMGSKRKGDCGVQGAGEGRILGGAIRARARTGGIGYWGADSGRDCREYYSGIDCGAAQCGCAAEQIHKTF